jgi:hypothetical protein
MCTLLLLLLPWLRVQLHGLNSPAWRQQGVRIVLQQLQLLHDILAAAGSCAAGA